MDPKKPLLFFVSTLLFITFVLFSYLVAKEVFARIDFDTTVRIQDHIPGKFDWPLSLLNIFGSVEVTSLVWLAIASFALISKRFIMALTLCLFWVGLAIEVMGKILLFHPAPPFYFFRGESLAFPSSYIHTNYSYPSGHIYRTAFLITFFAASLYLTKIKNRNLVLIAALGIFWVLMFVSRIHLGHHWLTDVIGGSLLGASFGIIPAIANAGSAPEK
ncbi:MAG: phosphatase PAP2 family protein [Candidatus Curtissbacteria bacterium]